MPDPAPLLAVDGLGRIEGHRTGVRLGASTGAETLHARSGVAPGGTRFGAAEITLTHDVRRDGAMLLGVALCNAGSEPLRVGSVVVGLRWIAPAGGPLRFLRHGWQSWSPTEGRALDDVGETPLPSGAPLRAIFHAEGALPPDRAGWHVSELLTAVGTGTGACVAGMLEHGESFGVLYLRPRLQGAGVELELEWRLDATLAPGDARRLEPARLALGRDVAHLLAEHAAAHGAAAGARTRAPFQAGWRSWHQFLHDVTEDDVRRNLEALAAARDELPVDVVQLDDGYPRAIGDWLEPNAKFPRGLEPLAQEIRAAGFVAGLWTAPFCAVAESRVLTEHPEWLLRQRAALPHGLDHARWTKGGWIHVLDASRDDVLEHLERTYRALAAMGWSYHELDFLYTAAMPCDAHDPALSRAQRLRRGLEAVRRGAGDGAFLLGDGCPLGAAAGAVNGMRVGPDVLPGSHVGPAVSIAGRGGSQPSTGNGVRNGPARAFLHRRLWLNDFGCLLLPAHDTTLTPDQACSFATGIAGTGGLVFFSDDVPALGAESRSLVRETFARAREIDAASAAGSALVGVRAPTAPPLAIFCDFDGTFAVQDVGSTLAKRHRAAERPAQLERLRRGELTPWDYNLIILDRMPISEAETDAFLATIQLDPGAKALVDLCRERGLPFRVLSDGFDRNLDRLQALHGVHFAYDANRLWFEGDAWRIEAGSPDPVCGCGTGVCKRARIEAFRREHPGTLLVHVGNGRVSDLCGARAADVTFAKDSLAAALEEEGAAYEPFTTLLDVVRWLEGALG